MKKRQWFFFLILPFLLIASIVYATSYEERDYLERLADIEEHEELDQWIGRAEQELLDFAASTERKIYLHEFLAHAYLYLEQFDKMKDHAMECLKIGVNGSLKSHVKGLNLLSIYYNALVDLGNEIHHKLEYSYKSRANSQRALVLLDCGVDPSTEAEVYFQAATLLTDSFSNKLFQAAQYFQKAMELFEKENQKDAYLNAKIHLAKTYLQLKALPQAERLIEEVQEKGMHKRTLACFQMVKAQLLKELGRESDALVIANFALALAKKLHIRKYVEQIEGLIHTL